MKNTSLKSNEHKLLNGNNQEYRIIVVTNERQNNGYLIFLNFFKSS